MSQKVFFNSSRGNKLCGVLSAMPGNMPVIILCHGFASSKDGNTCTELEKKLNINNISTFRIDLFGHGESSGSLEEVTVSEAVDDILSAISLMKKKGYSKIGLFGSSFGGMASIIAASRTDLCVLALKCPVSNFVEINTNKLGELMEEWKEKGHLDYQIDENLKVRIKYSFFEDAKKNNGYEAASGINAPAIIVHGDKDYTVPIEQSIKTSKIMKNCRLEIVKGAGHDFATPGAFDKMIELITGFVAENCNKI